MSLTFESYPQSYPPQLPDVLLQDSVGVIQSVWTRSFYEA